MNNLKIIAIGEFLWDYLPDGKKMGGAAANFSFHSKFVGAETILVSAIGHDNNGRELLNELDKLHIPHQLQMSDKYQTGKVIIELDRLGKPTYQIVTPVAWDDIQLTNPLKHLIKNNIDAFYFGSLIQRHQHNHDLLKKIIEMLSPKTKIIVDINLRKRNYNNQTLLFSIQHAQLLKLNDDELPIISNFLKIKNDPFVLFEYLQKNYSLELLIYTCGSDGSLLVKKNEFDYCPSKKIIPIDTVGAGDSFMAITCTLYLKGVPLKKINLKANQIASYVCTQNGSMPYMPKTLFNDI